MKRSIWVAMAAVPTVLGGLAGCGGEGERPSGEETVRSEFSEAIAVSEVTASGGLATRLVSKADLVELASFRYEPISHSATLKIGDEDAELTDGAELAERLSPEEANQLVYGAWQHRTAAAPQSAEGEYTTCTQTIVCDYFSLYGYTCYGCTAIDSDCNTGTQINCW